jgi:serine/threonine-protein kinase
MGIVAGDASFCLLEDEVLAFVAGELESQRRREVLRHVDTCDACRELTSEIARSEDAPESAPSVSRLEVGQLLSERFRLDEVLGRGAMGTVFRAYDEKLGAKVALKLLRRGAGGSSGFSKELRVGRMITHPNVCRLYDAGSTAHYDYITMELVEGESLAEVLSRGEVPRERALAILRDVAAGLAAAHAQGVVHRDLKPANVMIAESGRAVLTDFGLATDLGGKHSRRLVGTPAYWAPEQARGEPPTPASDVYSFGVMAYRLVAGRELALSDPDALDHVPGDLRRLVTKCTAPRPSERYRDGSEIERALREDRASRRTTWIAGGALLVVVLGAGWALTRRPPTTSPPVREMRAEAPAVASETSIAPPSIALPVNSTIASATTVSSVHPPVMAPRRPLPAPTLSAASAVAPAPSASVAAPVDSTLLYRR